MSGIPFFYKFAAIVLAWCIGTVILGIEVGGYVDDHYDTLATFLTVCALVFLSVGGLVVFLILLTPFLV